MKLSFAQLLVLALAADTAVASSWFAKAPYNKWHETELERWLSDHNVPYPTPADRKDLENIVKQNWQSAVESPYTNWDTDRLQRYLKDQGTEIKKGTEKNKDALVDQVKTSWHDADSEAHSMYDNVKSWIFNSWTESSLKAYCDRHGIPVPQPRTRDQALSAARDNYQSVANKVGETAAWPGNWIYESWSDSDLKSWLDERGIPAPQTGKRDEMVAAVRRNSYNFRSKAGEWASSATSAVSGAATGAASSVSSAVSGVASAVNEKIFDTWSDSQLKEWADKNGIKVPQGTNRNELIALARKNIAKLTGDNISGSAASVYGAATSSAGNQYTSATDAASAHATGLGNQVYYAASSYYREFKILVGLETNYISSASLSATSAYARATQAVKGEL